MTMINGFVDLREILKRGQHPAAAHSYEIQRGRWTIPGPVSDWYESHEPYCHQHDDLTCPTEW